MFISYLLFHTAHAFDENEAQDKLHNRVEIGVCAGVSTDCALPAIKLGFVHKSFGMGISFSPLGAIALSGRLYYNRFAPIQPYVYAGVMGIASFGGGSSYTGLGIGTDLHAGPFVLQPSIGFMGSDFGGALGLLIKL